MVVSISGLAGLSYQTTEAPGALVRVAPLCQDLHGAT
jgi:hypothetical protein